MPVLQEIIDKLQLMSKEWADVPMLARTHGQPATPTRVGKEFAVFLERILSQVSQITQIQLEAKCHS